MKKIKYFTFLLIVLVLVSCATTTTSSSVEHSEQKDIIVKVRINEKYVRSGAVWDWELSDFMEVDYSDADPTLPPVVELIDVKNDGSDKIFTFKFNREGHAYFSVYYHPYATKRDPYPNKEYFLHYALNSDFKYYKNGAANEVKRDPEILKTNVYEYGTPQQINEKIKLDKQIEEWEKEHPEEAQKYRERMNQIYNIERDVEEYKKNHYYQLTHI